MKVKHQETVVWEGDVATGHEAPEYPKGCVNPSAVFLTVGTRIVLVQNWIELTERELLEARMAQGVRRNG